MVSGFEAGRAGNSRFNGSCEHAASEARVGAGRERSAHARSPQCSTAAGCPASGDNTASGSSRDERIC